MYLAIELNAENFTKFSLEFFVVLVIFSNFSLIFLLIFQRQPEFFDQSGAVDQIHQARLRSYHPNQFKMRVSLPLFVTDLYPLHL